MTTIADVAARAGVGVGTVSRVLNGSVQVRPATRARVQQAIDDLGYEPSRASSSRNGEPFGLVGLLVPFFDSPSTYERLRGLVSIVERHGFEVVLFNVESSDRARARLTELPRNRVLEGLIIMSLPLMDDEGERLARAPFPVVLVDTVHPALPSVNIDDRHGGQIATEHLLSLGHERIAFIGEPHRNPFGFIASVHREAGFKASMKAAGLEVPTNYVRYGPHLRSTARHLATELFALSNPPTAIVAASDTQALGIIDSARASGRDVPGDVSVVGYDDIEMAGELGITTIRQPLRLSGQRGAELLVAAIDSRENPSVVEQLPLELVVRRTTGNPPGRVVRRAPTSAATARSGRGRRGAGG
ncbi:MAG: LacI family DNA-binding transcriptional regulator [Acidimicrobiia bacterium]